MRNIGFWLQGQSYNLLVECDLMSKYHYVFKVYIKLARTDWECVDEGQREPYFMTLSRAVEVQKEIINTMHGDYMSMKIKKTIRFHRKANAKRVAMIRRNSCRSRKIAYDY